MSSKKEKTQTASSKPRLVAVDLMVGLAMLLVVMGHMSVGVEPEWYAHGMLQWIYSFHMELFVFLSAFLIRYSYKGVHSPLEYGKYIWRKFKKFFLWFLVIGMGVAILVPLFRHESLTAERLWNSFRTLLLYPRYSEASFLWYIYILFGFYLVSPLFFALPQVGRVICCIAAMFLAMIEGGQMFCAYDFCDYTFFYCLGVLCAEWIEEIRNAKRWLWALLSVPFVVFSVWLFTDGCRYGYNFTLLGWWSLLTGVASLPFFYLLSLWLQKIKWIRNALTAISESCFLIYLLQMFIIWGVCHLLDSVHLLSQVSFAILLIVNTILAILIPILIAEAYKKLTKQKKVKDPIQKENR